MKVVVDRKLTVRGWSAEILVASARVTVYISHWSGLETYSVDGREALRVRSFAFSGRREIPLPDGRTLRLEAVLFPICNVRLVLDGTPVVESLFPLLRRISIGVWSGAAISAIAALLFVLNSYRHYLQSLPRR